MHDLDPFTLHPSPITSSHHLGSQLFTLSQPPDPTPILHSHIIASNLTPHPSLDLNIHARLHRRHHRRDPRGRRLHPPYRRRGRVAAQAKAATARGDDGVRASAARAPRCWRGGRDWGRGWEGGGVRKEGWNLPRRRTDISSWTISMWALVLDVSSRAICCKISCTCINDIVCITTLPPL